MILQYVTVQAVASYRKVHVNGLCMLKDAFYFDNGVDVQNTPSMSSIPDSQCYRRM